MTNEELVFEIKAGRNVKENMSVLYEQNKGLISKFARKYSLYAEYDDLMQEGYISLCNAVDKYNQERGTLFITVAGMCINYGMIECVRKNKPFVLPSAEYALLMKYNRVCRDIVKTTGKEPSQEELIEELGISNKELDKIERNDSINRIASIYSTFSTNKCDNLAIIDTIDDEHNLIEDVEESIYRKALRETIWKTVDSLPADQSKVIHEKYENGKSSREIGEESGMSINKVFSIENNALRAMRIGRYSIELRRFLDIQIYSSAIQQCGVGAFKRTNTSSTERVAMYNL